jgi:hypothetical protein
VLIQYRKKPVIIEAVCYTGSSACREDIRNWMQTGDYAQTQMVDTGFTSMFIETLEGVHEAKPGDYIIKGIKGEFYPCKPDIFEATYERLGGN